MQKRDFLDRLGLFALGCTTTRAPYQPQPQPQAQLTPAAQVTPRWELVIIGFVALVIISRIIISFTDNKAKRKKKKRSS